MDWFISHFEDYHDIYCDGMKAFELGCFTPRDNPFGYARYFALFYKGKRPPRAEVLVELAKVVEPEENLSEVPKW